MSPLWLISTYFVVTTSDNSLTACSSLSERPSASWRPNSAQHHVDGADAALKLPPDDGKIDVVHEHPPLTQTGGVAFVEFAAKSLSKVEGIEGFTSRRTIWV